MIEMKTASHIGRKEKNKMASKNPVVTIVGTLGQDPVAIGTSGIRLRVAQNNRVKNQDTGQWEDGETSWYTVKAWKHIAEQAKSLLKKGQEVILVGELREETWTDNKTGEKRSSYEITADHIGVTTYSLSKNQPKQTVTNSADEVWGDSSWQPSETVKVPF
jgi:single-strand DNA-binding protein